MHTKPHQGEHFLVGTDVATIKATGKDTAGNLLVLEVTVPPGGGPPVLHRHISSEAFYFLEGTFEITTLDGDRHVRTTKVTAGDTFAIPSMMWHNIKNVGDVPGKFVGIHSPAGPEDFIREIGQPIENPLHPPKPEWPPSEEQRQRMMKIITKYMDVLQP